MSSIPKVLFDLLLTQKIEGRELPYDVLQKVIDDSIFDINKSLLNAKISNFALNIDGKLVLGQIYVERKNAFIPVAGSGNAEDGASPTSYRVQVRFPFGLEMELNGKKIVLPSGEFDHPLAPYEDSNHEVHDDVYRSADPSEIVCGPGVTLTTADGKVTLTAGDDTLSLPCSLEEGKGYEVIHGQHIYKSLEDYDRRHKVYGVYPLFYSNASDPRLLKTHDDYQGFTTARGAGETYEQHDADADIRAITYQSTLGHMESELKRTPFGQRAVAQKAEMAAHADSHYLLNLAVINGRTLFADSGLDVIRLRSYQVELFQACWELALKGQSERIAGLVSMGVGAGKTYFTYALLQYLHHAIGEGKLALPPSYSFAPTKAVGEVTARTVNRQGVKTGTSAAVISGPAQMPTPAAVSCYTKLSGIAAESSAGLSAYMDGELQARVLRRCKEQGIHFNMALNLLYQQADKVALFKETVDPRRLILLLEGLKTLIDKTGMLPIEGLRSFAEKMKETQEKSGGLVAMFNSTHQFEQAYRVSVLTALSTMTYGAPIDFPIGNAIQLGDGSIFREQSAKLPLRSHFDTPEKLLRHLEKKFEYKGIEKTRFVRDTLVRLACLDNVKAAVLLANSGGLGNSYSEAEMQDQIGRILPEAHRAFLTLSQTLRPLPEGFERLSPEEQDVLIRQHYTLYLYLREIFPSIPGELKLQFNADSSLFVQKAVLTCRDMVTWLNDLVVSHLAGIPTVASSMTAAEVEELGRYGISPTANVVDAANQMAGIMALSVTGTLEQGGSQALWLSHIPVFTPEGFAGYVEYLDSLVGQSSVGIFEDSRVYCTYASDSEVTEDLVRERLQEVLKAVLIADEVHKPEFSCFFDGKSPVYQRINAITQKYLGQEFLAVLPSRIGMSGTINDTAHQAFRGKEIYSLSIQDMMKQGLAKSVTTYRSSPNAGAWYSGIGTTEPEALRSIYQAIAKQIVIDYFAKASEHGLDIFAVSQGLFFSKESNPELNAEILNSFNTLFNLAGAFPDMALRSELFQKINEARRLSSRPSLAPGDLTKIHKESCRDYFFALYLEFMLSKTSSPKEMSDLIGLQNRLHQKEATAIAGAGAGAGGPVSAALPFFSRAGLAADSVGAEVLKAIDGMNPSVIREAEVRAWVAERIQDPRFQAELIRMFLVAKKDLDRAIFEIKEILVQVPPKFAITDVSAPLGRQPFESRSTMALIGSDAERTGYSHEPVGIVVDVVSDIETLARISFFKSFLERGRSGHSMAIHLAAMRSLIANTFSYDEKTQMGGRALRTPAGEAVFHEHQSVLNATLDELEAKRSEGRAGPFSLRALRVETSFADIFTPDTKQAENARMSIEFNRQVFLLMEFRDLSPSVPVSFSTALERVKEDFRDKLENPETSKAYCDLIEERLPLLWAMAYQPDLATAYCASVSAGAQESRFDGLRAQIRADFQAAELPKEQVAPIAPIAPMSSGAAAGAGGPPQKRRGGTRSEISIAGDKASGSGCRGDDCPGLCFAGIQTERTRVSFADV